ncbi:MAG: YbaK/EbsC family protein [Streptomycetaceae bacterium]|nr:MAG: YbaK/EbsC family protein [Streptomycetaceae bacterium]
MEEVLTNPSVIRVTALLKELGCSGEVTILSDSARTALDAAQALGIAVGQVASSIVFKLPSGNPLLVITSGRHRVDTELVAKNLGVEKLHRADADFVKNASGFSIGGVSPVGWVNQPEITLIDVALNEYEVAWAAAGHPHSVYSTSFAELMRVTGATPMVVGD